MILRLKARHKKSHSWSAHAVMLMIAGFSCFPVYWMFVTALRPSGTEFDTTLVPTAMSLDNVSYVFGTLPVVRLLLNTLLFAGLVTVAQVLTSLLAAYAFTQWTFFGKRVLFAAVLATWLVPFQVVMIPNYVLLAERGWLDSLAGIILPQLAGAYGVLMLRQHLMSFPSELIEAATLDGRGWWATLWKVVVPNLHAPLTALALLVFVSAWNDYLWPLLVFRKGESVIQVAVQGLVLTEGNDWGAVMAASAIACIPLLALFVVMQRRLIDAFVRSGLK